MKIANITLLVDDYDQAIEFYTRKLGFELIEDTKLNDSKRWVRVRPKGSEVCLLLARASDEGQSRFVGNQTGGRVFLFLHTQDFWSYYQFIVSNKVSIVREPSVEEYGTVAVFADLYGNLWDLVEPG